MRRLVEYKTHIDVMAALNRAEARLSQESIAQTVDRLARIGRKLSNAGDEVESLPYLQAAVEIRGGGLDCHWLGATLVELDRAEEALPHLRRAKSLRRCENDDVWLERALAKLESRTCWFCEKGCPHENSAVSVPMYRITNETPIFGNGQYGTHYEWQTNRVVVPRCAVCQTEHALSYAPVNRAGYIGAAIGLALGLVSFTINVWLGLIGIWAGPALCLLAARSLVGERTPPQNGKPLYAKYEHPRVRRLCAAGWRYGDKPPGL